MLVRDSGELPGGSVDGLRGDLYVSDPNIYPDGAAVDIEKTEIVAGCLDWVAAAVRHAADVGNSGKTVPSISGEPGIYTKICPGGNSLVYSVHHVYAPDAVKPSAVWVEQPRVFSQNCPEGCLGSMATKRANEAINEANAAAFRRPN